MFRLFALIATRYAKKNIFFSAVNVTGLAMGMATTIVISFYVLSEWNVDKHFKNSDRIYRVGIGFFGMGPFASGPDVLNDYLRNKVSIIETIATFQKNEEEIITVNGVKGTEIAYHASPEFFQVFSFDFIQGNPLFALKNQRSAVLSERLALKLFNTTDIIGKIIEIGKERTPYLITGTVKDNTEKSHLKSMLWISKIQEEKLNTSWTSASSYIYVKLKEGTTQDDLNKVIIQMSKKETFPIFGSGKTFEEYSADPSAVKFEIQPLTDIYLKSSLNQEVSVGGNESNLYVLSGIALLIITISVFNFINLSIVLALKRSKEIGVKKAFGATRIKLIWQFIIEYQLLSMCALILSAFFVFLLADNFKWITGQSLHYDYLILLRNIPLVLLFSIVVGVLAGLYPALFMTSFTPLKNIKENIPSQGKNQIKKGLLVVQFAVSFILIISSIVINQQLEFMGRKDLGFNADNLIVVENLYTLKGDQALLLRDRVKELPGVVNATLHNGEPGGKGYVFSDTYTSNEEKERLPLMTYFTDPNYIKSLGFRIQSGQNFSSTLASDTSSVILNESAVKVLGITGDPVGQLLNNELKIIAVVADFHTESFRQQISPVVFRLPNSRISNTPVSALTIQLSDSSPTGEREVEKLWSHISSTEPFSTHLLKNNFSDIIESEAYLLKSVGLFTTLAIVISCLGLFSTAAYSVEQRRKEISVRKILGASNARIIYMLNRQLLTFVLVSILTGVPAAYYVTHLWLTNFAYRIPLAPVYFVIGSVLILVISIVTISFNSIKVSVQNPTTYLKED